MFCANTPHKIYDLVQAQVDIPIIHIGDATAAVIQKRKIKKVLFLGTKYTMTENFITQRIEARGIEVLLPKKEEEIDELHRIIMEELIYGKVLPSSKEYVTNHIQSFVSEGIEGVVLGCTEFPLMIHEDDLAIPIFNTTEIHAQAAVDYILEDQQG